MDARLDVTPVVAESAAAAGLERLLPGGRIDSGDYHPAPPAAASPPPAGTPAGHPGEP
jgi:hypothetical protein